MLINTCVFKLRRGNPPFNLNKQIMKTYDIYFEDNQDSNNCGFELTLDMAINYVKMYHDSDKGYFRDYKGGFVQVRCNQTGEVVYEEILY